MYKLNGVIDGDILRYKQVYLVAELCMRLASPKEIAFEFIRGANEELEKEMKKLGKEL